MYVEFFPLFAAAGAEDEENLELDADREEHREDDDDNEDVGEDGEDASFIQLGSDLIGHCVCEVLGFS